MWAPLAVQQLQHFFSFNASLFLRAQHLVTFQAFRMELAVPIGRKRSATTPTKILNSFGRFIAVHEFTPNGECRQLLVWRRAISLDAVCDD